MNKQTTIDRLLDPGVIAIVRTGAATPPDELAEALLDGGVRAVELTMTTPGALDSLASLKKETHDVLAIGVGSILNADMASRAIAAGARFILTPVQRLDVVALCRQREVPVICGAFTPTEAQAAHEAGADFVKIFPAEVYGPAGIKSILAPLPHLRLIPTGGVTLENCAAFLRAGCVAVGVGSALASKEILDARDWPRLTALARSFVSALQQKR